MSHLLNISNKKGLQPLNPWQLKVYTQISRHVHFLLLKNFLRYTPWGHLSGCRNVDMSLHVTSTLNEAYVLYFVISFSQFALMLCTSLMYADSASQETDGYCIPLAFNCLVDWFRSRYTRIRPSRFSVMTRL